MIEYNRTDEERQIPPERNSDSGNTSGWPSLTDLEAWVSLLSNFKKPIVYLITAAIMFVFPSCMFLSRESFDLDNLSPSVLPNYGWLPSHEQVRISPFDDTFEGIAQRCYDDKALWKVICEYQSVDAKSDKVWACTSPDEQVLYGDTIILPSSKQVNDTAPDPTTGCPHLLDQPTEDKFNGTPIDANPIVEPTAPVAPVSVTPSVRSTAVISRSAKATYDDFDVLQSDAKLFYESGDYEDAIPKYQNAIELGERLDTVGLKRIAELSGMLGHSYKELGGQQQEDGIVEAVWVNNVSKGIEWYTRSIDISKQLEHVDPIIYKARADANALLGNHSDAVDDYSISLEFRRDIIVFNARGRSHHKLGRCEKAAADFESAISMGGEEIKYMKRLADAYHQCSDYDSAIKQFTYILELSPSNISSIYESRGDSYLKNDMCAEAVADYQEALNQEFSNADERDKVAKKLATYALCK